MTSRVLNIIVIKRRAKPPTPDPRQDPNHPDHSRRLQGRVTEYLINLGDGQGGVRLRGVSEDLQAITTEAWLRAKTAVEGYLEAAAKLLVYLIAALSGNLTQAAAFVLMALLLCSAGLLALSNHNAKSFRMHGRVAAPTTPDDGQDYDGGDARDGGGGGHGGGGGGGNGGGRDGRHGPGPGPWPQGSPPYPHGGSEKSTASWPSTSSMSAPGGLDDWAEKGQVGAPLADSYPFDASADYS